MKTKIGSLLLAFVFILSSVTAYGADSGKIIQRCIFETNKIRIVCNDLDLKGEKINKEGVSVSLSGEPLDIESISTVSGEGMGKSIYCLVDNSGSVLPEQMSQFKGVMTGMVASLGENDNMAICTMGKTVENAVFTNNKQELNNKINSLAYKEGTTNLYYGITEGINVLESRSEVKDIKCLVIFSDGIDYEEKGITSAEVEKTIKQSHIPVYTVAAVRKRPTENEIEYSKVLGSFARLSTGGRHFNPIVDKKDPAGIGTEIVGYLNNGVVINVPVRKVKENMDVLLLRLVFNGIGGNKYEDSIDIYSEDIYIETTEQTTTETSSETTSEFITEVTTLAGGWAGMSKTSKIYTASGAGVAVLVIIALIVIGIKKSSNSNESENIKEDNNLLDIDNKSIYVRDNSLYSEDGETGEYQEETADVTNMNTGGGYSDAEQGYVVTLSEIGGAYRRIKVRLRSDGTTVVGGRLKKSKGAYSCGQEELQICGFDYSAGSIYLVNINSGEPVYVNGIPVGNTKRIRINAGDTVTIDGCEYRIKGEWA